MRNSQRKVFCYLLAGLLACARLVCGAKLHAQSYGYYVDECSSGTVDWQNDIDETVCLSGDESQLYVYAEVDDDAGQNGYTVPYVGVWAQLEPGNVNYGGTVNYQYPQDTPNETSGNFTPQAGVTYTLNGYYIEDYDASGQNCADGCVWESWQPGTSTSVELETGYPGLLYPKYLVMGVTYAPPGASSYVQYSNTTSVGTTTTNSQSFSTDIGYSVEVDTSVGIPQGKTLANGGVDITASESTDYTQTQTGSDTVTFTKSTTIQDRTNGYPTTYPPDGTQPPALPDDYDVIWLWLNPELIFTAYPAVDGSTPVAQWSGFAYDPTDQDGPDVYPVQVGCLNGDFTTSYCATQQGVLNRAWVADEMSPTSQTAVTAPGCPNGADSPSICPNTQDAYDILMADPLAYNPGGSTYTLFNYQPLPSTTSDGRYTQYPYPPNPLFYEPGQTLSYTVTQMNSQQQSQGGSNQVKVMVKVSEQVDTGFLSLFGQKTTWTETDTVTQENSWLTTLSTQQTVSDALSITGSNPPNYVPGEFILYQDNFYGTFLCYPSQ